MDNQIIMKEQEEPKTLFLDFFEGKHGKPVSRTEGGKICLLNFAECKRTRVYVHPGEQWKCRVDSEEEKKIIVTPLSMTLDAEENGYLISERAKLLAGQGWKVK